MQKIINIFSNEEKRVPYILILSAISLLLSFFNIASSIINPAWIAVIFCGFPIIKSSIYALIFKFDIKAGLLVSIALVSAVFIGEIFAAGEVAFIMALGELLEERTLAKTRAGIEKLVNLTPQTARVVQDGKESIMPAQDVQVDNILRVLPGETIAVDGIITSGQTSINQAILTGESLPIDKEIGDEVFSGTLNQFGTFDMKATKDGENSSLQRMIKLVSTADANKSKIVSIADRWATWIVVSALITAVLTWFFTGELIRAVTILVVFCPCSLVMATPTAIIAGIGNATKFGILIREGDALERLSKITQIAFDKTGTLTHGKPTVVAINSSHSGLTPEKLLEISAQAELRSEHPLGKAIVSHYKSTSNLPLLEPTEFEMFAGSGVKTTIVNNTILAGNAKFLFKNSVQISEELLSDASIYSNTGCTVIFIAINAIASGFIALSDTLRKDSAETIQKLNTLNLESLLLTGDNVHSASHIAKNVGIKNFHAECLPEDKLSNIIQSQKENKLVCMVGDGVNDAPALKAAFVGIAMGGIGSDIAVDAADIVLVNDDIKSIPHLFKLSQKTMSTIKINLTLSMLLNLIAVVFAMTGLLGPILGALVHNVGSFIVILNSALLLNFKK